MPEIELLLAFLKELLPSEVAAKAVALGPVLAALVSVLWQALTWVKGEERIKPFRKLIPLVVLVLGQGAGAYAAGGVGAAGVAAGLLTAVLAIGSHSGLKNLLQIGKTG